MTTPPPPRSLPAPTAPPEPPARRGPSWLVALAVAVAALAGGLAVGALVLGDDASSQPEPEPEFDAADETAAAACAQAALLPASYEDLDDIPPLDEPDIWRFGAVETLGKAAGTESRRYRAFGERTNELRLALNRFDLELVNDVLAQVRDDCVSFGFAPTAWPTIEPD